MEFEESDKELDDDLVSPDDLLSDESGFDDMDLLAEPLTESDDESIAELVSDLEKKDKARLAAKRSLKVRRAIEDFFEEQKVKHELDYLFEDDK